MKRRSEYRLDYEHGCFTKAKGYVLIKYDNKLEDGCCLGTKNPNRHINILELDTVMMTMNKIDRYLIAPDSVHLNVLYGFHTVQKTI